MSWFALTPSEHGQDDEANATTAAPVLPEPPDSQPSEAPAPPTLAEIAELADDFERNHALYELVAGSGRAQVEDLLELTFDLPPSLHRHDIVRVLYVRFAAIDPVLRLSTCSGPTRSRDRP